MTSSRSTRARLSVCLIGRNEARHLPGCLETVRDWADELVLIDTGSTDGTPDIARRAGARVFPLPWEGDFSKARNTALERATGDWVLFIDCDERLDYVSGRRLPRWTSALSGEDACHVRILSQAGVGSSLNLLSWSPRLVRRDPKIRFVGALHERLHRVDTALEPLQGTDITLHHIGYSDPDRGRVQLRRQIAVDPTEAGIMPPDPAACLKLANTYVALDEFERAEGLYRILLAERAIGDLRPVVYWNLAISIYRSGDARAAFEELDRAAQEFPTLAGTHLVRAQILMDAGRHAEAEVPIDLLIQSADEALFDYPDLPASVAQLLTLKGECLAAAGDLPSAGVALEEALARDQSLFIAHDRRADLLVRLGANEEALSGYLRAAALRPDLGKVRIKAGLLLEQMDRTDDGLVLVREAARLDPQSRPDAREILNRIVGVPEPVIETVEALQPVEVVEAPAADAIKDAAADQVPGAIADAVADQMFEMTTGATDEIAIDAPAAEADVPFAEAEAPAAEAEAPAAEADDAQPAASAPDPGPWLRVETLERELSSRPGDHELQYQLGLACLALGEFERAEPVLRAAVRPTGDGLPAASRADALSHLARMAFDRNDLAQASRDARAAVVLSPESVKARLVLASAAYRNQHFADAAQEYRRILNSGQDLEPEGVDRPGISRELGICLYRAQKFDEAAEAFAFAVTDRPRDALGRLFLGNALAHLGRFESAWKAFREAVEIDPELTDARGNLEVMALELGYRHYDAGRHADALALVPEGTRHTELLFLKAISQHGVKDFDGARGTLEFLNSLDDSFAEAHWNLALVCRALGDLEAARTALARFRHLAPGDKRAQALEEALQTTES